jgi:hypothetical protein
MIHSNDQTPKKVHSNSPLRKDYGIANGNNISSSPSINTKHGKSLIEIQN